MKVDRHGKAKIFSQAEIQLLFSQGFQTSRDSEALLLTADRALFGICLFTACRLCEACTLYTIDAYEPTGGEANSTSSRETSHQPILNKPVNKR